ncbi:succinate dehydrogenase, cytochrome b556 subunit [Hyphomicrobium sp.]|uniref:succinate dehydrogenase, cytochrome b556 subunit n=1 Tax=Hyphomicrobium sp. TaxID=82 RepID=UPI002E34FA22|nr:succinate dehydrogenase, cytochrome b556 subunit [Hyphomicrobium sp.]HEX2840747.1 succinate dehydrogenase, cytochrome b556 subunit [Hyphomicrobium sp.]
MADANAKRGSQAARPLSPHLQIYKMPINMLMSIVHRITGGALYVGTILVACVLVAAASGADAYNTVTSWLAWWPGQIVLIGYTWALLHHLAGGVRHFIWDTGHGYALETVDLLSWGTLAFSATATVLIWGYVLLCTGGAAP